MKMKITTNRVIRNYVIAGVGIFVTTGLGYQIHENHQLNNRLSDLSSAYEETVSDLDSAEQSILTLEQQSKKLNQKNEDLQESLSKEKEISTKYDKQKKELQSEVKELNTKLDVQKKKTQQALSAKKTTSEDKPTKVVTSNQVTKPKDSTKTPQPKPQKKATASSSKAITTSAKKESEPTKKESKATTEKVIEGVASAYTANCKGCSGITASGKVVSKGMVAMDSWVPLGTKVKITSQSAPHINGVYTVEDRGGAIDGNRVDIFMKSHSAAVEFGMRDVKIEILG